MAGVRVWRVAAIVFLSGCASKQVPIPLAPDAISKAGTRVGIVVAAPLPTADTTFPGADCLLCMAAANIANTSLTSHTKTLTNDDLAKIRDDFARAIRKKGATPILIAQPLTISELPESDRNGPNIARIDY